MSSVGLRYHELKTHTDKIKWKELLIVMSQFADAFTCFLYTTKKYSSLNSSGKRQGPVVSSHEYSHYPSGSTNVKNVISQATTSFLKQLLHKLYQNVDYKVTDV